MPTQTVDAWLSLYAATGLVALICAVVALAKTACDYLTGARIVPLARWSDRALALPRVWLCWQGNYLAGAPVVVGIAPYYAAYIGFDTLGNV